MSNPGHNGISFSIEDLRNNIDVYQFLLQAVDYGNLTMVEHATRYRNRKRRLKFYLNPLYCPIFRIPYQHTKEPKYISVDTLRQWLADLDLLPYLPLLNLMDESSG